MDNIGLMSETINFIQGSKKNYDSSAMQGGVYFSKDSKEILLNGKSYGNAVPADEEDLTSVNQNGQSVLKFADKPYSPENFNGKGYIILRKNIQKVSIPIITITVNSIPTTSGNLTFAIDGITTNVAVSIDTETSIELVVKKIADYLEKDMSNYIITTSSNVITLTCIYISTLQPSSFSANSTGIDCIIADSYKDEYRNVITPSMISASNTIYEIKYDFELLPNTFLDISCEFYLNGGSIKSKYVYKNINLNTTPFKLTSKQSNIFNSAIISAPYLNLTVNDVVNPTTKEIAINNATIDFANGYIERKNSNGKYLPYNISMYSPIRATGPFRFYGNWHCGAPIFKSVYTSDFIGLTTSLADIYENILFHHRGDFDNSITIIVDSDVIIDRTIYLVKNLFISGNQNAKIKVTINDGSDIFVYTADTFSFTKYEETLHIKAGYGNKVSSDIMIKGLLLYSNSDTVKIGSVINIQCAAYVSIEDLVIIIQKENCPLIFKCYYEGLQHYWTDDYTDFLSIKNVSRRIGGPKNFDVTNPDIIIGNGDCSVIDSCSNVSVLIYGGQKVLSNLMHCPIYAYNTLLHINNMHTEESTIYIDKSKVVFESCLLMNAFMVTDACVHVDSGKVKEYVENTILQNNLNYFKASIYTSIKFINSIFLYPATSSIPLRKAALHIKNYNTDENTIELKIKNTYASSSFNPLSCKALPDSNMKLPIINSFFVPSDAFYNKITFTKYNNYESNRWVTTQDRDIEYFKNPRTYDVTINHMFIITDLDRKIGFKKKLDLSFSYTENDLSAICMVCKNINEPVFIVLDCTIDGIHTQGYVNITNTNIIAYSILKDSILNKVPDIYIDDVIQPIKYELIENNVIVNLDALPTIGNWKDHDIVIVDNIKYEYLNNTWNIYGEYKGTSIERPSLTLNEEGFKYYDTTLNKQIIWNGNTWTNTDGTTLDSLINDWALIE